MTLEAWMHSRKLSDAALGRMLGVHRTYIWKLRVGERVPSPKLALRLVSLSGGKLSRRSLRPDIFGPAAMEAAE